MVQHDVNKFVDMPDSDHISDDNADDEPVVMKSMITSDRDVALAALDRLLVTSKLALKVNWLPALVLNLIALLILLLFFSVKDVNEFFTSIADMKDRVGLPFGIISTSIAAGVLPAIFMTIRHAIASRRLYDAGQTIPQRKPALQYEAAFLIIFWGYRGLEADLFYRLQSIVVGSSGSAGEVTLKVMVDMFVYNPIWACPQVLVMYFWKDACFTIQPAYDKFMSREFYTFILPSALLTTWIVWTPACAIIYCLPAGLQLIMMNIVCCFWSILLQIVTKADSSIADKVVSEPQTIEFVPTHEQYESDSDEYDDDVISSDEEHIEQSSRSSHLSPLPDDAVVIKQAIYIG